MSTMPRMLPKELRACLKTRSMSGRFVTSATQGSPPTSLATLGARSPSLSTHSTRAPACDSARAVASPMPCPAPRRTMPRPSRRSRLGKSVVIEGFHGSAAVLVDVHGVWHYIFQGRHFGKGGGVLVGSCDGQAHPDAS